jgi:hypothetical protein
MISFCRVRNAVAAHDMGHVSRLMSLPRSLDNQDARSGEGGRRARTINDRRRTVELPRDHGYGWPSGQILDISEDRTRGNCITGVARADTGRAMGIVALRRVTGQVG